MLVLNGFGLRISTAGWTITEMIPVIASKLYILCYRKNLLYGNPPIVAAYWHYRMQSDHLELEIKIN